MNGHTAESGSTGAVTALGLRVRPEGTVERVELAISGDGSGRNLAELIGCRVFDVIGVRDGLDAWVDDEALLGAGAEPPAVNVVASLMVSRIAGMSLAAPIVGTVVFTGVRGANTAGLSEPELVELERLACAAAAVVG